MPEEDFNNDDHNSIAMSGPGDVLCCIYRTIVFGADYGNPTIMDAGKLVQLHKPSPVVDDMHMLVGMANIGPEGRKVEIHIHRDSYQDFMVVSRAKRFSIFGEYPTDDGVTMTEHPAPSEPKPNSKVDIRHTPPVSR